jgi:hypothetical protein
MEDRQPRSTRQCFRTSPTFSTTRISVTKCRFLSELPWAGSTNQEAYSAGRYQLGQKTTIVGCVSNRPLPCDLYSAPSLQILTLLMFPPKISPKCIRPSIARYEKVISAAAQRGACSSCGRLAPTTDICPIGDSDKVLDRLKGYVDHCGRHGSTWDLCRSCLNSLIRDKDPELSL